MNRMEEYVSSILSHGEFSEQDRIELAEEFLDHLHQLQRDYLQAGYSPEEAEQLAIRDFGGEQEIGEELQESQAPHYRLLLLLVGAGSILFTILHYLYALFILQAYIPLPMVIGMLLGSSLLWFYWNPEHIFQRKLLISTILILLTLLFLYWSYVAFLGTKWMRNLLLANTALLLLLSWLTLLMTAWKKPLHLALSERKQRNVIHTANVTLLLGTPEMYDVHFSPDEKQISFVAVSLASSNKTYEYELFTMDLETKQAKQITTLQKHANSPVYFHKQNKLLFLEDIGWPAEPSYQLRTVNTDGSNLQTLQIVLPK
ncbi:permease prefix domain 1-containing protein [Brevibacillus laterosporus]|uniref:permease prefix domain 1-containing protein n=1 Tax=Brevibacillus laterosporus TaxID=1465 RepID=UPI0014445507|nr:permease prefix domain 1-containing protein [Brevibacillus laterosporus]NKQ20151.1 hypothetical protein [Brevibacillus laterosporus]WNX29991.1 permease prefix domain 1-containing protein [Brevibacillus laterosporus]